MLRPMSLKWVFETQALIARYPTASSMERWQNAGGGDGRQGVDPKSLTFSHCSLLFFLPYYKDNLMDESTGKRLEIHKTCESIQLQMSGQTHHLPLELNPSAIRMLRVR